MDNDEERDKVYKLIDCIDNTTLPESTAEDGVLSFNQQKLYKQQYKRRS